jgi:Cytochrome oxidase complex assembly protein 1
MMKRKSILIILGSLLGIGLICLACLAQAAAVYFISTLPLRLNPGLAQGMKIINNDPVVAETFGSPVRSSLFVMGKLQEFLHGDGTGSIWTPISGPKNKGEANFYVKKTKGGSWQLDSISIDMDGDETLVWDAKKSNAGFRKIVPIPSLPITPMPLATIVPIPSPVPPPTPMPVQ